MTILFASSFAWLIGALPPTATPSEPVDARVSEIITLFAFAVILLLVLLT